MIFEEALQARMTAAADVTALVGSRVFWTDRPQDSALPALVMEIVADPRPQNHDGFDSLRPTRVQFDCWARSRLEAGQLRDAVIEAIVPAQILHAWRFGRGEINVSFGRAEDTSAGRVHRQIIDATLWHGPTE